MGMTIEQIGMLEPTEDELWSHARKAFEDGLSVAEICARYGLKRATVYQRAQVWRAARGEIDLDGPPPKAAALADIAWRRLALSVEAGRIQEALCWRALTETLEKRAAKEAWAETIKGKSLREASDALIARCDQVIADEKAMKAASLDTPSLSRTPHLQRPARTMRFRPTPSEKCANGGHGPPTASGSRSARAGREPGRLRRRAA